MYENEKAKHQLNYIKIHICVHLRERNALWANKCFVSYEVLYNKLLNLMRT